MFGSFLSRSKTVVLSTDWVQSTGTAVLWCCRVTVDKKKTSLHVRRDGVRDQSKKRCWPNNTGVLTENAVRQKPHTVADLWALLFPFGSLIISPVPHASGVLPVGCCGASSDSTDTTYPMGTRLVSNALSLGYLQYHDTSPP